MKNCASIAAGHTQHLFPIALICAVVSAGICCGHLRAANVVAWGDNSFGACDVPAELTNAVAISAGISQSLALRADGTIVGWGSSFDALTIPPAGLSNVIAVAIGLSNSLALKMDGSVVTWGTNVLGTTPGTVPQPPGLSNIVAIVAGFWNSLALRSDGNLYAWIPLAGNVQLAQSNIVAAAHGIAAGTTHSLALRPDGSVVAWGDNGMGQCNVPTDLSGVIAVAGGNGYSLALKGDGTVVAWGGAAPALPPDFTNIIALSTGGTFGLALRRDGTVSSWGTYWNGSAEVPMTVPAGLSNVVAISAGGRHALALVGDGPPVTQETASDAHFENQALSLSIPTENGRVYQLEYKNSFSDPEWIPLPLAPGIGAKQILSDLTASNSSRIYRVRRW